MPNPGGVRCFDMADALVYGDVAIRRMGRAGPRSGWAFGARLEHLTLTLKGMRKN